MQLVADRAARSHIEVEAVYPVGEPKGAALLDLVATETRLRGPDGCPWDREQTHASLARHLVEEAYEVLDAIEEGDPEHLREELGDLLLQVVFHAQLAEDAGDFDVDGVARAITEKLVRRHPHVFGDLQVASAGEVVRNWEAIKREEEGRTDPLAGIPSALPALQLAAKLQKRAPAGGLAAGAGSPGRVRERLDELAGAGRGRRAGAGGGGAAVRGGRPGQGQRGRAGGRPAGHRPPLPGPVPGRRLRRAEAFRPAGRRPPLLPRRRWRRLGLQPLGVPGAARRRLRPRAGRRRGRSGGWAPHGC